MSASRILGLVVVSSWLAAGCSSAKKIEPGATCLLNTDCKQPLVCTMNKCHEGCRATVDCPPGQICTKVENSGVCQLPAEAECSANVTCGPLLICATDLRCRAGCGTPADCMEGQVCVQDVCAENKELQPNGQLPQKAPPTTSDAGAYDTASPDLPVDSSIDLPVVAPGPEAGLTYDAPLPDVPVDSPADMPASGPEAGPEAAPESGPEVASDAGLADAGGIATGGTTGTGGASGATATGGTTATAGTSATGGTPVAGGTTTTGGATTTGGTTGAGGSTATVVCPSSGGPKMVRLPENYCIDSTEVTRAQYQAWLDTKPTLPDGSDAACGWNTDYMPSCEWPPGTKPNHPVVCVDWCDAYGYCQGVGKRLCGRIGGGPIGYAHYADANLDQWFNACVSGATGNAYPYGSSYSGLACNGYDYGVETTVEVGSIAGCQSSVPGYEGVFDLSGNVWEWEDSCSGSDASAICHCRGGPFSDQADGLTCDYIQLGGYARNYGHVADVGFRCCYP